jgi:hypothetical protein
MIFIIAATGASRAQPAPGHNPNKLTPIAHAHITIPAACIGHLRIRAGIRFCIATALPEKQ